MVVDPVVLSAAGAAVVAAGDGLAANLTVLVGGFAANTGHDHGGTALGLGYQCAGQSLVSAAAAVVNACRFNGAKIELSGALSASTALVGGQQIPEGAQIGEVLSQIGDHASSVGAQCGKLAATLDRFAEEVSYAQKAIRDLLHRLGSLGDIAHDIALVLEGKAFDEVERIAADINAVLHCLGREAPAWEQSLDGGVQAVDGLVVGMERFMGGQFTHFLGQQVGNQVAATFDTWVNTGEGFLKGAYEMARGIEGVDPWWFVLDPQGAAAMEDHDQNGSAQPRPQPPGCRGRRQADGRIAAAPGRLARRSPGIGVGGEPLRRRDAGCARGR